MANESKKCVRTRRTKGLRGIEVAHTRDITAISRINFTYGIGGNQFMKEAKTVVAFKTPETVNELCEKAARMKGRTKSEFLSMNVLDSVIGFERTRHMDTLADFNSILQPHIVALGVEEEAASKTLAKIMESYCKERLSPHMRLQRHLTDIAIRSFLEGYMDEMDGLDAKENFIINQSLAAIYDYLHQNGLMSKEDWQEKNLSYNLYMDEVGRKLLHQRSEAT